MTANLTPGSANTDLVVGNIGTPTVTTLLGNGNGTFQNSRQKATSFSRVSSMATGTFTSNGYLDVAVTNVASATGRVDVLEGQSGGGFRALRPFAAGFRVNCMVAGDFNNNGTTDLAIGSARSPGKPELVQVFWGNGNGSFTPGPTIKLAGEPSMLATGDLASNGRLDIVAAIPGKNDVDVIMNNGDGTFAPAYVAPAGRDPISVTVGSVFAGSKYPDRITANLHGKDVGVLKNLGPQP
jgi:FG-GAP-like repeat